MTLRDQVTPSADVSETAPATLPPTTTSPGSPMPRLVRVIPSRGGVPGHDRQSSPSFEHQIAPSGVAATVLPTATRAPRNVVTDSRDAGRSNAAIGRSCQPVRADGLVVAVSEGVGPTSGLIEAGPGGLGEVAMQPTRHAAPRRADPERIAQCHDCI